MNIEECLEALMDDQLSLLTYMELWAATEEVLGAEHTKRFQVTTRGWLLITVLALATVYAYTVYVYMFVCV